MAEPKLSAAHQWLDKAKRDLAAAERLMSGDTPLLDIGAYHCQQTVEKALKAFLTYHETPFEKTHNLVALLDLATKIDPGLVRWLEAAKTLTPYATEFRYPGELLAPGQGEASRALSDARAFLQDLDQRLPRQLDSEDPRV
jgi:HEPN domain-containing protein